MYKNSPKLMLRVDLEGEKDLRIMVILLDKYFADHYTAGNLFIAKDGFTIYRGNIFTTFKAGSLHLPKQFLIGNKQSDKVSFASDKERYEYLKRMKRALLEWSYSCYWRGFSEEEKVKLTFRDKVWLLF